MMDKIRVTEENCEAVAMQLVGLLFDKKLTIASFFANSRKTEEPKLIRDVSVVAGFSFEQGVLTIPLKPRRSIKWDVLKEEVWLTFNDDHVIIERKVTPEETIFRVIVYV